jgi:hypothetical protein
MPTNQCVSTRCDEVYGAGGETRTPNRPITNRVLYQLSHASTLRILYQQILCQIK